MEAGETLLALSTFPDEETARTIVRQLVEANLVACGNIISQVESIYRWQGKVELGRETLALFKLTASRYREFEEKLRALHPYEVPEIISCKVDRGLPEYLRWVAESCAR
jgi:periplasmic divalent cation tolerance protein